MLLDRNTIFLPVINQTLPNMGIKVRRIDYKSPWQNGVAERFILTLQTELLDLITPLNADHMKRIGLIICDSVD